MLHLLSGSPEAMAVVDICTHGGFNAGPRVVILTDPRQQRVFLSLITTAVRSVPVHAALQTLLGPQSQFGDQLLGNLSGLSAKRDCSSKSRVKVSSHESCEKGGNGVLIVESIRYPFRTAVPFVGTDQSNTK